MLLHGEIHVQGGTHISPWWIHIMIIIAITIDESFQFRSQLSFPPTGSVSYELGQLVRVHPRRYNTFCRFTTRLELTADITRTFLISHLGHSSITVT